MTAGWLPSTGMVASCMSCLRAEVKSAYLGHLNWQHSSALSIWRLLVSDCDWNVQQAMRCCALRAATRSDSFCNESQCLSLTCCQCKQLWQIQIRSLLQENVFMTASDAIQHFMHALDAIMSAASQ